MEKIILIRFGEISLKGKNRGFFVTQLVKNIKWALRDIGPFTITSTYGRIYVYPEGDMEEYLKALKKVPGIVSLSPTVVAPLDMNQLKEVALAVFQEAVTEYPTTFKVKTSRANKKFPWTSPEVNQEIGGFLLERLNADNAKKLSVDVHNPAYTLNIEIRKDKIYIFTRVVPGPGGLPIGSSGKGLLLLSGGIDSPVAGWLGMKRGIALDALYFHSFPYTSDRAKEKVIDLSRILSKHGGRIKLYINFFTNIQMAIQEKCPSKYLTIIMRRMMFRLAHRIATQNKDLVLLTGESVGQVASQTLESMQVINEVTNLPILRPLITMDKSEIVRLAREIGTYETSILPYEDCCTIFVPKHPETRPKLKDVLQAEAKLPIAELIEESLEKTEVQLIGE